MRSTPMVMGTITVRLDVDDELLLDELAAVHGDRSTAVRAAIRLLSGETERRRGWQAFLEQWEREVGPIDEQGVQEYIRRYDL